MQSSRITRFVYLLTVTIILISMVLMVFLISFESVTERIYMVPIKGTLSTDSYQLYPYSKKDLEIGFSRYGEFITPQNVSYAENYQLMGRGLSYEGHEAFACPDDQNRYYPVEGWFLQYSYLDLYNNNTEKGVAYALYSDLDNRIPEAGRTQNLLAEPIKIIYNNARRFVAEVTVHILHRNLQDIINLKQTIVYNKASKHVIVLMDVIFLRPPEYAGPLHLNFSRRVNFKLAHSLTLNEGKPDSVYSDLQLGLETAYEYLRWPSNNQNGYYDLVKLAVTPLLTGGLEYNGFIAFWPNVTDNRLYGWNEWNKAIEGHEFPAYEPQPVFVIGEWDTIVPPGASKRFVVVYGIVDGKSRSELQRQVDRVFNPWDLSDATSSNVRYKYIFVGRDSPPSDFASAIAIAQEIQAEEGMTLGFDRYDADAREVPYLISILGNIGKQLSYYDSLGRLHLVGKRNDQEIAGSTFVVLGGGAANMGTEYFNDYIDAFSTGEGIYAPGSRLTLPFKSFDKSVGYAVIGACQDPNGTSALVVWGFTANDTWYAASSLHSILEKLQAMPSGITAIILKFNYSYPPDTMGFLEPAKWLGTITEFAEAK